LGYQEALKLCQEALTILEGGSPVPVSEFDRDAPRPEEDSGADEANDSPESQRVGRFLSETDQIISETYSLMRKLEAMKDVEDMSLDALAESIGAFTSATKERLNKH